MRKIALFLLIIFSLVRGAPVRAADALPQPEGPVILTITGEIEQTNALGQARFDRAMLEALGTASITTGSVWTDYVQHFEGVPMKAVLDRVGARGTSMIASALNDYKISIPFSDLKYSPLLAMKADGRVLALRDRGPLWIVYPRDDYDELHHTLYESRWVWQLNRLHIER
ncbi:oxidoreductase [Microvirga puerhi]|uniref:Oxidoreductase n=1 Tax=Microvirga puerhi TaxID=2876078 RepID=A0ABS7VIM6_9HYPH|nr:oxidoreductase [Microvirga puerhi]MBZ6075016.1 oxidoreductase [Microvirga puerhi]